MANQVLDEFNKLNVEKIIKIYDENANNIEKFRIKK